MGQPFFSHVGRVVEGKDLSVVRSMYINIFIWFLKSFIKDKPKAF